MVTMVLPYEDEEQDRMLVHAGRGCLKLHPQKKGVTITASYIEQMVPKQLLPYYYETASPCLSWFVPASAHNTLHGTIHFPDPGRTLRSCERLDDFPTTRRVV